MKTYRGRFMREAELRDLGVAEVGENVAVHETCVLVAMENMRFGSNVRIDPFTLLSAAGGWLRVGDFVHVSSHCAIMAGAGVELADFAGVAAGARILSRSDDFSGGHLTGPTVPAQFTSATADRPVRLGRHVVVGAGSVVLPQVEIGDGTTTGAGSIIIRSLDPWGIYVGAPAKFLRNRRQDIIDHESRLRAAMAAGEVDLPVARL
ncbi:acyltransferase [Phenylobacterium sp.]|uniref:acyltransferase n=1 Tax=Phenylobacterium sp. TaxID=1871053 RepID=UPI00286CCDF7|nr:acyltransferase [Phenylobacterium sp.]